jgi:Pyruvate/2-oxoacid:ferredoxin oxidoreductase delta subunit
MVGGTARSIMLKVDDDRCQRCKTCLSDGICRGNAFVRFERAESPYINMSKCWGCLVCVKACPFEAVVRHTY